MLFSPYDPFWLQTVALHNYSWYFVFMACCSLPSPWVSCSWTVVPRMPVQIVLTSQVSVLQMTGCRDDGSSDSCLSVSHTVVLVDDACDCFPLVVLFGLLFFNWVSSHTGVFFSSRNVIWFLFLFSVNKWNKITSKRVAIKTTWAKSKNDKHCYYHC